MTTNSVPFKDISSLTTNFALLGCQPQGIISNRSKYFCKEHDHEKRIYCKDCRSLICVYCQLYGGHKGHTLMVAAEACMPPIDALKKAENNLVLDLEKLVLLKDEVKVSISKLLRDKKLCERNVMKYYCGAMKKLETRKDFLISEISSWVADQMFVLNAQLV